MKFIERLKAPSTTDKNYIKTTHGGYNYCIHIKDGSCLPNCVGYAWGRWRELLGKYHNLSRGNAEVWYGNTGDGYKRGKTPKLGSVICWAKGKTGNSSDGAGHVAIVEQIKSDGTIVISNSAYGGTRFYLKTLKPPYNIGSSYTFQGFIYLPIEFDVPCETLNNDSITYTVKSGDTLSKIAHNHGTTWQKIYNDNKAVIGSNPNLIKPGQKLVIKTTVQLSEQYYIVQKGDSLSSIANKCNTTWQKIYNDNKSVIGNNPNLIKPGQKLVIK